MTIKKNLPAQITSYDLLKFFAVVTMLIDHTGGYFFPDDLWWRAVGRLSAPVWLFLIGYARSRDLSPSLWVGAGLLIAASFVFGGVILPVNILVPILIIRMVLDKTARYALSENERMVAVGAVLFMAGLLTNLFMDYGSIGLIVALSGWMARQRLEGQPVKAQQSFSVFACFSIALLAITSFDFTSLQMVFIALSNIAIFMLLYRFRPAVYGGRIESLPGAVKGIVKFCGRWTLEIYVAHLLLFKALCAAYNISGHGLFDWVWVEI